MKVALAPATVRPAPSAAAEEAAFLATVMLRSSTSSVAVFRVVVVPLTVKSPESVRSAAIISLTVMLGVPVSPPAVPETLPVTSPVRAPAKLDAVSTFVEGLYTRFVSTLTSSLPELASTNAMKCEELALVLVTPTREAAPAVSDPALTHAVSVPSEERT